ncbi:2-hydroxyacid dehydrogenase [Kribbella sandramycini]|uniref:2-hydroxyacid dehydrogenase n=1 Tax=Kribbella sandramycini TaxID=60450 RepID=A0A7Y4P2C0_9ACTN|nr:2-hydroxyacid dehydrogenase [Kribbella sandramycini]MBB6570704.1 phosphoglycerate dehydrogenase-like enzyme [Kribbella sandramycini]NOL43848.1 2-hydroxyacid dehydrogenase [Kribbella sandramycini]
MRDVMAWLPWADPERVLGGLPVGVKTVPADGSAGLDEVEFFVPPYMVATDFPAVFAAMPALEVVQLQTAGFEGVLPVLPDGVSLCNARGVHDASTAELTVGLILASYRRIPRAVRNQEAGHWPVDYLEMDESLADRTVLIVGYGSIGEALERRLAGFECEVLRVARRPRDGVHPIGELPELLPRADVVVLLTPATDETRGMVDAKFLAQLKDGALLVNVARGVIVDTDALVAELATGRIAAALDVTEPEPLPTGHPLWSAPNVLINPHRGGASTAFEPRVARLVRAQLERYQSDEALINVVAGPPR